MDVFRQRLDAEERKYEAIKAAAEQNLAAIRRVRKLFEEGDQELPFPEPTNSGVARTVSRSPRGYGGAPSSANGRPDKINLARAVREAIQETVGEFQQPEITQRIRGRYPNAEVRPPAVTNAIARMVAKGQGVEVVRKGFGSDPNTYRKVPSENIAQEGDMSP